MSVPISPIYRRLPPGPHQLSRGQVIRHQRIRIHGAMVEAVAREGYEGTSVRQVVSLAGVSRRCFYEQFANKEDCFVVTFDLLARRGVQRMTGAYTAASGDLGDRLGATLLEFADVVATRPKAASFVLVEAQTAGPRALLRLHRATADCERLLARSFSESPGATVLPAPLVRAIAGGLRGAMSACLRERSAPAKEDVAEAMVRWTLHFQSPAAERMSERMADRIVLRLRESASGPRGSAFVRARSGDTRTRLLENALHLAAIGDYRQLTASQIADGANVSMDVFFELFADKGECFLAALDMLADELVAIATDPDLRSSDWPHAVRRVIGELMCFLAEHPLYARTIAHEAFAAGPDAARRVLQLAHAIATLLTPSAPKGAQRRLLVDGLAGAIWHTIRCQVAACRIQLLPALSDYLAYVALAPSIGADAAADVVSE
jgi:AcrR family transcriptional regulator